MIEARVPVALWYANDWNDLPRAESWEDLRCALIEQVRLPMLEVHLSFGLPPRAGRP